jgi:DNA-binding MarR family transcriptional regulator
VSTAISISQDKVERLADIIMVLQRCFILRLSRELSGGPVSFAQFFLLGHIDCKDGLSMSKIAETMHHTTAAATGLVDRLENLGYVRRTHAQSDRRKVLVRITDKGTELVHRIRQDMVSNLHLIMETLSPEEQAMWVQIYEKIFNHCKNKTDSCTD